jgi:hypothetical protein
MRDESNRNLYTPQGQPLLGIVGPECREADGAYRIYDGEGYSIPIPPDCYFPDPDWPRPDEGSLAVENAALRRVLRRVKETIWAACIAADEGHPIPSRLNHALAKLDEDMTHFETLAECPDPDPVLTHAMNSGMPERLPWHVARDNGLLNRKPIA